jgi:hypothetical protein
MTRNDIIRMALEAGFGCDTDGHIFTDNHDGVCDEYLERFANLVAEAEREGVRQDCPSRHRSGQMKSTDIIKASANSLNIYSFTAEAIERLIEAVKAEHICPTRSREQGRGMNREDIASMALEAGFSQPWTAPKETQERLTRFAALVAAAEQDRCCKIIYSMAGSDNVAQRTVDAIKGKQ